MVIELRGMGLAMKKSNGYIHFEGKAIEVSNDTVSVRIEGSTGVLRSFARNSIDPNYTVTTHFPQVAFVTMILGLMLATLFLVAEAFNCIQCQAMIINCSNLFIAATGLCIGYWGFVDFKANYFKGFIFSMVQNDDLFIGQFDAAPALITIPYSRDNARQVKKLASLLS